ncbi:MAG TPA: NAD-dependent epimerase/dehydratase family protein [Solirubrobacteraceae bacterium]|jgi:dihydroflavonol-4-reductase|nr:NAD-dependent epimerase/dehydratase family protein [Solirubrobacteraceae bacterium]
MPRTLVTGATGFIGSHVARLLVQRGDDVHVLVRPGSPTRSIDELDLWVIPGDILDRRSVRRAMRGVDRVFHVAGCADLRAPRAAIMSVAVEGTTIVLEEAARAGVERAVYTSSAAAIGPASPGKTATENSPWTGEPFAIPYLDAMREAESVALRLVARGLPLVIVNPTHVLGAGDHGRSSTALVLRFLQRQIPAYVDGTLNIVGVHDAARGHLLAEARGRVGERYILGNRNFTMTRLFADLGRLSGVQPPTLKLPVLVAMALASAAKRAGAVDLPTATEVRAASLNWRFSNRKAKRELGWTTSPHEDCLEETIAWYRARDDGVLAPPGTRQPLPLRVAAGAARRVGL